MACFCCNQGLERWEEGDDAWIEHAKYNPSCSYVLLCKGKSFVDEACKSYEDEACKIVADEACKVEDNVPKIKQVVKILIITFNLVFNTKFKTKFITIFRIYQSQLVMIMLLRIILSLIQQKSMFNF